MTAMETRWDIPSFATPGKYVYRYRFPLLSWLLEGHAYVREMLIRAWPGAVSRRLVVTERAVEIPFVLRSLSLPAGSRVLDVGSRWSPLPLHLSALGLKTVAVDLARVDLRGAGLDVVRADMRRSPFRGSAFDAVIVVSTLEHVGLAVYDARSNQEDDFRLMEELRKVVRPAGLLLLTVPYGRAGQGPGQRSYDQSRLARVTEGWAIVEASYYVKEEQAWRAAPESRASNVESAIETHAVALLVLRRVE